MTWICLAGFFFLDPLVANVQLGLALEKGWPWAGLLAHTYRVTGVLHVLSALANRNEAAHAHDFVPLRAVSRVLARRYGQPIVEVIDVCTRRAEAATSVAVAQEKWRRRLAVQLAVFSCRSSRCRCVPTVTARRY